VIESLLGARLLTPPRTELAPCFHAKLKQMCPVVDDGRLGPKV